MDLNVLPPDLFTTRVPSAMRDQVPHVVDGPDGAMWSLAGSTLGPSGRRGKGLVDSNDPGYRPGRPLDRLADRQSRKDAVAVGDGARVAVGFPDENRDDRKGNDEHQRGERHVAGTPPVSINDGAGELRHQCGANPDPGHRDAKC